MAKEVTPRTWVLEIGEANRRYSDAPFDLIPPTSPVIAAFGTPTISALGVQVTLPAVDARTTISGYVIEYSSNGGLTWAEITVGPTTILNGIMIPNLLPGQQYKIRVSALDNSIARNRGLPSNIITQTTDSGVPSDGLWPNWPIMNVAAHQGNASLTILDATKHSQLADKDLVMFQSFYPNTGRLQSRIAAITSIRALQDSPMDTQFIQYVQPFAVAKTFPSTPGQNESEITKELIEDGTKGNNRWYIHRTNDESDAGRVENFFSPTTQWAANFCHAPAETNSLGQTYGQAYWNEWDTRWHIGSDDIRPYLFGVFRDACTARSVPLLQNNGANTVTDDVDFNYDDVAENQVDFGTAANSGATQWSAGQLRLKAEFEAKFSGKFFIPNGAEWDLNYGSANKPPLPLSNHPFYRKWEIFMDEVSNNNAGLLRDTTLATGYKYSGGGSAASLFKGWAVQERFLKLDADIPASIGKGCLMGQSSMNDRTPTQDDIEFARTMSLVCLLVERVCPAVQAPARVFSLDELLVELGPPDAPRTMGTLNENTLAFTLRAPDATVGTAKFYWAQFAKGIVVWRGDNPTVGVWPSGTAVSVTLPSPGVGKVWKMLNANTYVNPKTGRATRNQSPSINNGATVTTLSLKPMQARLLVKV